MSLRQYIRIEKWMKNNKMKYFHLCLMNKQYRALHRVQFHLQDYINILFAESISR